MNTGRPFEDVVKQIAFNAEHREDVVARLNSCQLTTDRQGHSTWKIGDAGHYDVTPIFHRDVADAVRIPQSYYADMKQTYPALLDANVNAWLRAESDSECRLMRLFDSGHNASKSGHGTARAIRSTAYLPLDDDELLTTLQPILDINGVEIQSCEITERRTFIKLTTPRLKGDVKVGDTVQGGVLVSNSEIGQGNIVVAPFIFRLICTNGMTTMDGDGDSLKRMHRGAAITTRKPYLKVLPTHERRAAAATVWEAVSEALGHAIEGATFQELLSRFKHADKVNIKGAAEPIFTKLAGRYSLTEKEQSEALANFESESRERSVWGLANSITALANHEDNYERASYLEGVGGKIIQLPENDWKELADLN